MIKISNFLQDCKKYLTGQSSSVPAERIYSMVPNILTKKRSQLCPEKLDLLIFIDH